MAKIANAYWDDIEYIVGQDRVTGELEFMIDETTSFTQEHSEEESEVTGRKGHLIAVEKRNKALSGEIVNGIINFGMLGAITGNSLEERETANVPETEVLVLSSNTATTKYTAVGTVGAELNIVYTLDANGNIDQKLTQTTSSAPQSGEFKYDPETKTLTFAESDEKLTGVNKIRVFYKREATNVTHLSNSSDKFSKTVKLTVFGTMKDTCDRVYRAVEVIPRCSISGTCTVSAGGDEKSLTCNYKAMSDNCGGDNTFYDLDLFQ